MTKLEFIAQFGNLAEKMMASKEFVALLETAREENPFIIKTAMDPTTLINQAGAASGWAECIKWLKTAHKLPEKKPDKEHTGSYRDPNAEESNLQRPENKK